MGLGPRPAKTVPAVTEVRFDTPPCCGVAAVSGWILTPLERKIVVLGATAPDTVEAAPQARIWAFGGGVTHPVFPGGLRGRESQEQ